MPENKEPSWKVRRRIIYTTLIFCAGTVAYVLWKGNDTTIGTTAITMAFMLAGSIIGSYIFSATWQDISLKK